MEGYILSLFMGPPKYVCLETLDIQRSLSSPSTQARIKAECPPFMSQLARVSDSLGLHSSSYRRGSLPIGRVQKGHIWAID